MGVSASIPTSSPSDLSAAFFRAVSRGRVAQIGDVVAASLASPNVQTAHQRQVDLSDPAMRSLRAAAEQADVRLIALSAEAQRLHGITPAVFWGTYFSICSEVDAKSPETVCGPDGISVAAMDESEDELLLHTFKEVFVYRVPPRASALGHVAASWGLGEPALENTFLRVTAAGDSVSVAIWQRVTASRRPVATPGASSGAIASSAKSYSLTMRHTVATAPALDGHVLIAAGDIPVGADAPPTSVACEPTIDSSRYFVLRLRRSSSAKGSATGNASSVGYLGFGFRERDDAFAFKAAIEEYRAQRQRQRGVSTAIVNAPAVEVLTGASAIVVADGRQSPAHQSCGAELLDEDRARGEPPPLRSGLLSLPTDGTRIRVNLPALRSATVSASAPPASVQLAHETPTLAATNAVTLVDSAAPDLVGKCALPRKLAPPRSATATVGVTAQPREAAEPPARGTQGMGPLYPLSHAESQRACGEQDQQSSTDNANDSLDDDAEWGEMTGPVVQLPPTA